MSNRYTTTENEVTLFVSSSLQAAELGLRFKRDGMLVASRGGYLSFSTGLWVRPGQALNYPTSSSRVSALISSVLPSPSFSDVKRSSLSQAQAHAQATEDGMTLGVWRPPTNTNTTSSYSSAAAGSSVLIRVKGHAYPLGSSTNQSGTGPQTRTRSESGASSDPLTEAQWKYYTLDRLDPSVVTTCYRFTRYDESCPKPTLKMEPKMKPTSIDIDCRGAEATIKSGSGSSGRTESYIATNGSAVVDAGSYSYETLTLEAANSTALDRPQQTSSAATTRRRQGEHVRALSQ
ncbi:hypothetical protein I316_03650 [Kwoniella heveanensis BCC8398]|uniref:Uncharacterized protein n=1 Tax=Kwoniella heveanensis BCC8398 TaxID=1296120 RepID=A0A1B9GUA5_9TREE|nr:hypothetical protein I316_03650 [Kwoniella heveanensis BCC8398]